MKVIFLDNDGVICLSNNWGSRYKKLKKWIYKGGSSNVKDAPLECRFDDLDEKAVKILNTILKETGAEIIVSSDWQGHATCEELGNYYISQGIDKRPIGVTKECGGLKLDNLQDFPWDRTFDLEQHRTLEIQQWLRYHPEVTHWVAIDDLHMGKWVEKSSYGPHEREWGLENFVWTPRSSEGIKQSGIKEKVLKFLK